MEDRRYSDLEIYRRLLRQARPYWGRIATIFFLSLLSAPLALLPPLPLKLAVDSVIGDEALPGFVAVVLPQSVEQSKTLALISIVCMVVLFEGVAYLHYLVMWLLKTWTGQRLVLELRSRLFRRSQALSLKHHDSQGTSDSIYRIQYDSTCVSAIAMEGIAPLVTSVLTVIAMLYVTARIDLSISLIALGIVPLLIVLTQKSRKRLRGKWGRIKQLESRSMSLVQEVLGALRVVKAFGREDDEQTRYETHAEKIVREHLRAAGIEGGFDLLAGSTIALGSAAALFVGVSHVRSGVLTLGDLILVMAYLVQLYLPLENFVGKVGDLQSALASAERVLHVLDEAPDVPEAPQPKRLERARGRFLLRDVSFAYEPDRPALQEINVEISPGSRVGIAGPTGAGKSTLTSLLIRFYDPTTGVITLDNLDLRELNLADLRRQFAVVLQESVLFSTSIAENIAYARPGASLEDIEAAAKAANADGFISELPQRYETQVGERGLQLSGGERQRISLARAFLKDAPILILDEPTSAIDMETEAEIIEAMERLMEGRTTFMIAHRLITLKNCDQILQLEGGRLKAILPPAEILRQVAEQYAAHSPGERSILEWAPSAAASTNLAGRKDSGGCL